MRTTTCSATRSGLLGQPVAAIAIGCLFATAAQAEPTSGERWVPGSGAAVVLELPVDAGGNDLAALRRTLAAEPTRAALAERYVDAALRRYARDGDPRLLGYAEGALQPWLDRRDPPQGLWKLRGRLLQTRHEFSAAAADLERLLSLHPDDLESRLLAADAYRRAGDTDAARRHCLQMQLAGHAGAAALCAADLLMTLGRYDAARSSAAAGRARLAEDDELQGWARAVEADAAFASGDLDAARRAYDLALAEPAAPLAVRLARVDVELAAGNHAAALRRLDALPPTDAVLLRRAIAGDALRAVDADLHARLTGMDGSSADEERHWRERARYALDVLDDPALAVDFATRNWRQQKGWEDAELLLEAAAAAGDAGAAEQVDSWRRAQREATT